MGRIKSMSTDMLQGKNGASRFQHGVSKILGLFPTTNGNCVDFSVTYRAVRLRLRIVVVLFAVLAFAAIAASMRDAPVLYRVPFRKSSLTGDYNYVLFNPLRDRSPERVSAVYLNAMRRGDCIEATKASINVSLPDNFTCEQMLSEHGGHLDRFVQRLRDRKETQSDVVLYYSDDRYDGNWVSVRRFGRDWRVVGFHNIW